MTTKTPKKVKSQKAARIMEKMKASAEQRRRGERGYALVAILALMSLMALAMIAAAPNLQKRQQRELELEAISRGENMAEAIGEFVKCRQRPPNSLEELVKEGCPALGRVTKRRYLVRESALKDPLSRNADGEESEWRLVAPQSRELISFSRAIASFAGGQTPQHNMYPQMKQFAPVTVQLIRGLDGDKEDDEKSDTDAGTDSSNDYKGVFVGVSPRSRNESVIAYYGIEKHNRWIFTPAYR